MVREANRWVGRRMNRPSLTDQYLMQLTRYVAAGNGVQTTDEDVRIKFGPQPDDSTLTPEEQAEIDRAYQMRMPGIDPGQVEHKRISKAEARANSPFFDGRLK